MNWPNLNTVVSQGTERSRERERKGQWLANGTVRTHTHTHTHTQHPSIKFTPYMDVVHGFKTITIVTPKINITDHPHKCNNNEKVWKWKCLIAQSCPILCNPMDCATPRLLSVHDILQARILEWVAIPFPGDLLNPGIESRSLTLQADSLLSEPPGKP